MNLIQQSNSNISIEFSLGVTHKSILGSLSIN